ncbi:MAG: DNA polymerase I [Candidatus Andersenbacteria bacterium RIFCSPHIGHO2_12_FULL_45_11b]|uniref:DNA polymerase I n=1 Tax=Candidatus Andersenbacteria bacterium RIFCSPHIGHO2_12_FULL_45_11b TaxID=1797282 RepID=A0A1G1X9I2_9BACT|nr:MAG: DNA polymerase I [Candidatus Andersenbacteria bacterium RIFCSPHIGHO2_12_FULL_45_11b]
MAKRQKLAIIDAHALIHRAYHALPPMSTEEGVPTNAVYGFTTMLLKMIATLKPTHVIAAFDMKGPTFRHEKYADYKAHRKVTPDDLIVQFDIVRDVVRAFSIPIFEKQGFEADDIIGTLVKKLEETIPIVVVTGDMDTLQLVSDRTSVFTLKRGISDTVLYTPELVKEKYGFDPQYIPDYKGLAGDPSDNIKGVAGIGAKTAKDLVGAYGPLENIFKHAEELPARAQKMIIGHEEDALFSRQLAVIHQDVPVDIVLDDALFVAYDEKRVREVFQHLGFRSLINRLPKSQDGFQPTLGLSNGEEVALPAGYKIALSSDEQLDLQETLKHSGVIAFDTETDGLGGRTSPIIGMSFAAHVDSKIRAWYVPVDATSVLAWKEFLEDSRILKTGHNLKYDMEVLAQSGIHLQGIVFDTMLASYLLRPGVRSYGMDDLAEEYLGYTPIPITDLIGSGKNQKSMRDVPLPELARYAAEDADVSLRLYDFFLPKLQEEKLADVLREIEIPLVEVLVHMEITGVALDEKVLKKLSRKVTDRISIIEQQIWSHAGSQFNIDSPKQLRDILFQTLQLPTVGIKKTQSGFSTAADELEKLMDAHPIVALLSEYRELSKLKNTYLDALPPMIEPKTGRVYATFNQTIAATGRLSSSNPNLQNIPIRSEFGQEIRRAFVARQGFVLVKADYSQLELRIAAHVAQDEKFLAAFRAGEDIHKSTAAWVFSVPVSEVTDDMRRQAKTLNFGVLYGMGAQSFARTAKVSVEEARSFIDRYQMQYSGITKCIQKTIDDARAYGYVETMFGRRRYIPEIQSNNPAIRAGAERAAFNFPIQGAEADILKKAMIALHARICEAYAASAIVLTVHDELVCEVRAGDAAQFARDMKAIMEGVIVLDAPLIADVGIGKNWGDIQGVA